MNDKSSTSFAKIWSTLLGGLRFCLEFLKNPIANMKAVPEIPISEVFLVQWALAAICGLAMGLVAQSFFQILWGVIFYPIVCTIVAGIVSLILYYISSYMLKREFKISQFYVLVFLSSIPAYVIRILSPLIESIDLLGLAIASAILRMGLIYSYKIERKKATQIVALLYGILLLGFLIRWIQEFLFSSSFYSS